MSLPELPEGLRWRVERVESREFTLIGIYIDSAHGRDIHGGYTVDVGRGPSEDKIVTRVEAAAQHYLNRWNRHAWLDGIIERHSPCQIQS